MEADTKEEIKEVKTDKQIITPQSNTPASSHSSIECEYDNKRGFDPASKDDLDDIGLSYYMENNNEESWNYTQELNVLRALI